MCKLELQIPEVVVAFKGGSCVVWLEKKGKSVGGQLPRIKFAKDSSQPIVTATTNARENQQATRFGKHLPAKREGT